ncbi:MAG: sulfotransferase [Desulfomonilaceae bacterium]
MSLVNNLRFRPQIIPGMTLKLLLKSLILNDCQVDTACYGRLAFLSGLGVLNSMLGCCETFFNSKDINSANLGCSPLFVIGHWRSGTTHLHNLLSLDKRFSSPTAYQASFPNHFIFSQVANVIFNLIAPPKRPMDEVAFSAEAPHEDEFALAAGSLVSPYMKVLFPRTAPKAYTSLDPREWSVDALLAWKRSMLIFVKKMTLSEGGRLLFKSPPHMGRIELLADMFPNSQFLHIVRNPYNVYLSTKKLWRDSFAHVHLQTPTPDLVQETILSWYEELFALFERDRQLIGPESLVEIKYEDLDQDPITTLAHVYEKLRLSNFEEIKPCIEKYILSIKNYKKNTYDLTDEEKKLIASRWGKIFLRYNYEI